MSKPTRAELEAQLAQTQGELDGARLGADATVRSAKITALSGVAIAVIGAVVAIGAQVIPENQTPITNCPQQRNQAVVLAEKYDGWTNLPEESPAEEQCAINDWVVDQTGMEPTEPDAEGEPDP